MGHSARFCYVMLCHTRPEAVLRGAARIRALSPQADIMLRFSVPGLIDPDQAAEHGVDVFEDDLAIRWGDWTMVAAEVRALGEARRRYDADYFVLLSGQDYPIRDLVAWEREVAADGADLLIDPQPGVPDTYRRSWWRMLAPRPVRRVAGPVAWRIAERTGQRVSVLRTQHDHWYVGVPRRGEPPVPVLKASMWITLSARGVDRLVRLTEEDGPLRRFFARTRVPDELFPASVLSAQPDLQVEHRPTTFAWFEGDAPNPNWVDLPLLEQAAATSAPFIRKVHPDCAPEVIEEADRLSRRPA